MNDFMLDEQGRTLQDKAREFVKNYKMFWRGGGGRELDWRLRITLAAVEDAGKRDVTPELEVLDKIFRRFAHHRDVSELAARAAAVKLKAMYDEIMKLDSKRRHMLGEYDSTRAGSGFCFSLDPGDWNQTTLSVWLSILPITL